MPRPKKNDLESLLRSKIDNVVNSLETALSLSMSTDIDTAFETVVIGFGLTGLNKNQELDVMLTANSIFTEGSCTIGEAIIKAIKVVMYDEIVSAQIDNLLK